MRVSPQDTDVPSAMHGAWHVDAHVGSLSRLLKPNDLVASVFFLRIDRLTVGEEVRTLVGRFYVDTVIAASNRSHVLLRTNGPGLVSRFGLTAAPSRGGRWAVTLHNSVHPRSWVGRLYFRLIEPFHHFLMEHIALRRLAARAEK